MLQDQTPLILDGVVVTDFVAIDFETYTANRDSACAIGIVVVLSGVPVQKFYTLINPFTREGMPLVDIHGIDADMLDLAPSPSDVLSTLLTYSGELPFVCHNASFDINILNRLSDHTGIPLPNVPFFDTYKLTRKKLVECCTTYNIPLEHHHDALFDAVACAEVFLHFQRALQLGEYKPEEMSTSFSKVHTHKEKRTKYQKETLCPLSDEQIVNKETVFYHARTVITGTFYNFPVRDDLAQILRLLGADINTSISKKTNVVVVGDGAGPKKLETIYKINSERREEDKIKIVDEEQLVKILDNISDMEQKGFM